MDDFEVVQPTVSDEWLLPQAAPGYGSTTDLARELCKPYQLKVGNRPVARSLRKLMSERGLTIPPEIAALPGETYVITHAVGMIASSNPGAIKKIGLEATFSGDGSTVELAPSTSFRTWMIAGVGFEAGLTANGGVSAPLAADQLSQGRISLGAGAEIKVAASATGTLLGNIAVAILSPVIQATGISSSSVTWQIDKDKAPLVGDQVLVQTVLVPAAAATLSFRLRGFAMIDPGWFKRDISMKTPWFDVQTTLS